ncbi:Protein kinase C theta type [Leucoagaricus sp. SymC.cos]|nr:Protein kinase C theta type [Leucoagaricus sp. SymC.cos]
MVDPMTLEHGVGLCLRRSDGKLYAIKRRPQSRQTWSELDILVKIKEAHAPFSPLLYWTYEKGQDIYFIMENYPMRTLSDAVGYFGAFGSLEIFFYACELVVGLSFLHDIGIIHRSVSPATIIFDRKGHLILSGLENALSLRAHEQCFFVPPPDNRHYQAPEILLGWRHDQSVDSWSFGLILSFMFRGKHVFFGENADVRKDSSCDVDRILLASIPSRATWSINPIARDLISKVPPLPREFLSPNVLSTFDTLNDPDFSSLEQCFSPRLSVSGLESCQQSFGQVAPQFLQSPLTTPISRDKVSGVSPALVQPISQSTFIVNQKDCGYASPALDTPLKGSASLTEGIQVAGTLPEDTRTRMADFWDVLDREDRLSTHSEYSAFSHIKMPFSRAWALRKERSLMIYPHRLFSLSTTSIQQKLRRRPKSVAALKYAAYAEPIAGLPGGLSQIGSGIGFTYVAPASPPPAPPSSVSISSEAAVPDSDVHPQASLPSVSSFWAGFKSGSVGVPVASISPHMTAQPKESGKPGIAQDQLVSPISMSGPYFTEPSGCCQSEIIQPLAESTAFLSPVTEVLSPATTVASTDSIATENEALTPDTIEYRPGNATAPTSEGEIVEMKRSEEAYGFGPESTLRLVTSMNGLRLAFAGGLYSS